MSSEAYQGPALWRERIEDRPGRSSWAVCVCADFRNSTPGSYIEGEHAAVSVIAW
ncbi:hypothetical protein CERSUDRAFT_101708 [Gelatoporia subvermispora B]|uniref:Uncharacterized protein n=1 Tax=Ceriporiopsis subvermispora (strain B) TaxID=914234 RepID=M2QE03_CERS8|nr:hypothetical protein CERSUDRAFT_101708 [Gelatoporia subvermispora B]